MDEKLERMEGLHADAVHMGVCTKRKDGTRCPVIQRIADRLHQQGAQLVDGTH